MNFDRSPTTLEYAKNLIDLCLEMRVAIVNFADPSKVEQALGIPEINSYVRMRLSQDLKIAYDMYRTTGDVANIQIDIDLAEILAKPHRDPDPEILNFLFRCNALIQRYREAMNYLLGAAKKDIGNYGGLYIKYCFELQKEGWYKKAIEFYENNKKALDPILDDQKKAMIANAYDRIAGAQSEGFTKTFPLSTESIRHYAQTNELLAKAHAIHREIYDKLSKRLSEGHPLTEEEAPHLTNYAVNLYQLALLSDCNIHIDESSALFSLSRRIESTQILEDLIQRVDAMDSPSERLVIKQKIAKAEMVCASASDEMGIDTNEKAILFAKELILDPEIQKIGRYSNFLNAYGIHLGIQRRRLNGTDYSKEERVLTEALMSDWKNYRVYLSLSDLHEEKGELETAKRYRVFRHLIQAWGQMRQALNFEIGILLEDNSSGKKRFEDSNPKIPSNQFDRTLKTFLNEAIGHGSTSEKIFRPLNRALRSYGKKIRKWIRGIAPDNCNITTRVKSPYSILLKMLKEGKNNVTEISNLLTIKIETETDEDAKQLCQKIEQRMVVSKRRDHLDEPSTVDLRFMDLTGHLNGDPLTFLIQVRPKEVEAAIEKSKANYENYKLSYIAKLDAEIAKDPKKHLQSFHDILIGLGRTHQLFSQAKRGFSLGETLKVYADPDWLKSNKK